jgi:putative membrane protein
MRIELNSRTERGPAQWVTQWLISAVGLALAGRLFDGVHIDGSGAHALMLVLGASAVLGLLNLLLKPLLILITLPVNILTLGLFTLVVNAVVLLAAVSLVPGLRIEGFWTAVWAALFLAVSSMLLNALLGTTRVRVRRRDGGD